jgi:heptosyltransferase II
LKPLDYSRIDTVIWMQTSFLGDIILSTAAFRLCNHFFPNRKQIVITTEVGAQVLQGMPEIDQIIVLNKRKSSFLQQYRSLRRDLALVEQSAVVMRPHRSARSALLCYMLGIPTVTYQESDLSWLSSVRVSRSFLHHESVRISLLLEALGPPRQALLGGQLRLPSRQDQLPELLAEVGSNFIALAPGSVWATKALPANIFASILEGVFAKNPKAKCVLVGQPNEVTIAQSMISGLSEPYRKRVTNLVGKTTIPELCAVIEKATMVMANDSAPLHIAAAYDRPVAAFFGSTVPEMGFGPLSSNAVVIESDVACRPCGLHGYRACPRKHFDCMNSIDVQQAVSMVSERFGGAIRHGLMGLFISIGAYAVITVPIEAKPLKTKIGEIISIAMNHSHQIKQAQAKYSQSDLGYKISRASSWPDLKALASLSFKNPNQSSSQEGGTDTAIGSTIGVAADYELWTGGRRDFEQSIASIEGEIGRFEFKEAKDTVISVVASQVITVASLKLRIAVYNKQIATNILQVKQVKAQYLQGFKAQGEYTKLESEVERVKIQRDRLVQLLTEAEIELRNLLSSDTSLETLDTISLIGIRNFLNEMVIYERTAKVKSSELQIISQSIQAVEGRRSLALFKSRFPTLSITANAAYGYGGDLLEVDQFRFQPFLGLTATLAFPLWNYGRTAHEIELAQKEFEGEFAVLQDRKRRLYGEIAKQKAQWSYLLKNIQLTDRLIKLERQNFSFISDQFVQGRVNSINFLSAQRDLQAAERSLVNELENGLKAGISQIKLRGAISEFFDTN